MSFDLDRILDKVPTTPILASGGNIDINEEGSANHKGKPISSRSSITYIEYDPNQWQTIPKGRTSKYSDLNGVMARPGILAKITSTDQGPAYTFIGYNGYGMSRKDILAKNIKKIYVSVEPYKNTGYLNKVLSYADKTQPRFYSEAKPTNTNNTQEAKRNTELQTQQQHDTSDDNNDNDDILSQTSKMIESEEEIIKKIGNTALLNDTELLKQRIDSIETRVKTMEDNIKKMFALVKQLHIGFMKLRGVNPP
jgi:chaperonin cofactor prefoldin